MSAATAETERVDLATLMQSIGRPSWRGGRSTVPAEYGMGRFFVSAGGEDDPGEGAELAEACGELHRWLSGLQPDEEEVSSLTVEVTNLVVQSIDSVIAQAQRLVAPAPIEVLRLGAPVPEDVLAFCRREGVVDCLFRATQLIDEYLQPVAFRGFELVQDPETDDEWVTVSIVVSGDTEEILDRYDAYTGSWVAEVPWPERSMIRLSFNVV